MRLRAEPKPYNSAICSRAPPAGSILVATLCAVPGGDEADRGQVHESGRFWTTELHKNRPKFVYFAGIALAQAQREEFRRNEHQQHRHWFSCRGGRRGWRWRGLPGDKAERTCGGYRWTG